MKSDKYNQIDDLPSGVTNNLPKHAQEIYKSAFNTAAENHDNENDQQQIAHRVAWSAVKQKYEKTGNRWKRKYD